MLIKSFMRALRKTGIPFKIKKNQIRAGNTCPITALGQYRYKTKYQLYQYNVVADKLGLNLEDRLKIISCADGES